MASVTFRQFNYKDIIHIAADCGLDGIEWGGDIHVPTGNALNAEKVRKATYASKMKVLSYGSYYRLGAQRDPVSAFKPVLETALRLDAGTIRVWAGDKNSARYGNYEFALIVGDAKVIADMANEYGVTIAFEYHRGTWTDTSESAVMLLEAIGRDNVKTYWQPNPELGHEENLRELKAISPWLANIHVFNWDANNVRLPLKSAKKQWLEYCIEAKTAGVPYALILEFVIDDDTKHFEKDAQCLIEIEKSINGAAQ